VDCGLVMRARCGNAFAGDLGRDFGARRAKIPTVRRKSLYEPLCAF